MLKARRQELSFKENAFVKTPRFGGEYSLTTLNPFSIAL